MTKFKDNVKIVKVGKQFNDCLFSVTARRPPKDIKAEVYDASPHKSLVITFDAKQGDDIEHEIAVSPIASGDDNDKKTVRTTQTKVIVNDLTPGRAYNVTVRTRERDLYSSQASQSVMALMCELTRHTKQYSANKNI